MSDQTSETIDFAEENCLSWAVLALARMDEIVPCQWSARLHPEDGHLRQLLGHFRAHFVSASWRPNPAVSLQMVADLSTAGQQYFSAPTISNRVAEREFAGLVAILNTFLKIVMDQARSHTIEGYHTGEAIAKKIEECTQRGIWDMAGHLQARVEGLEYDDKLKMIASSSGSDISTWADGIGNSMSLRSSSTFSLVPKM